MNIKKQNKKSDNQFPENFRYLKESVDEIISK